MWTNKGFLGWKISDPEWAITIPTGSPHSGIKTLTLVNGHITGIGSSSVTDSEIGSARAPYGSLPIANLMNMNGNKNASGPWPGSGLRIGFAVHGISRIENLMILNGNSTASIVRFGTGIKVAAGIGSITSPVTTLSLMGGRITAKGTIAWIRSSSESGEIKSIIISGTTI